MKLILTITKDTVAEDCQRNVMLYENAATAKRAWGNGVLYILKQGNPENIPVEDLQIWKIGELDTETMEITPCKEFIASGAEFIIKFGNMPTKKPEPVTMPEVTEIKEEEV